MGTVVVELDGFVLCLAVHVGHVARLGGLGGLGGFADGGVEGVFFEADDVHGVSPLQAEIFARSRVSSGRALPCDAEAGRMSARRAL